MIFILNIRPVNEKDLSPSNPFPPEANDYDIFVSALLENLAQIDGIINATKSDASLCVETNESISEEDLKKRIRPAFTNELMKCLRFMSLVRCEIGYH